MRVEIRPLVEADAYTSYKWRNDPEVFKYTGNTYDHEITLESELSWIRRVIANPNDYRCAILADSVYVGNIYLTDIVDGNAEYHIFIGNKDYWGKGVAMIASRQIIDYGFEQLCLSDIHLEVQALNLSAFNLYQKLGFQVVGTNGDMIRMNLHNDHTINVING